MICFHVPSTGPGSEELLRKNWFSVKMSDPRSMEFYVNRIPLSSPSVLRRTLVNPPGNAQWWQSQLCGRWACWSPTPLPRDTAGDPAPFQVAGQTSGRRRVWTSAVGMEEGKCAPTIGTSLSGQPRLWPVMAPACGLSLTHCALYKPR